MRGVGGDDGREETERDSMGDEAGREDLYTQTEA